MASKDNTQFGFTQKWIIYATPAKVFEALTDASIIEKWSGEAAEFNLEKDGRFMMFGNWVEGNVETFVPGKSLSYSWKPNTWGKKTSPSVVKYAFVKHEAGCEIVLEHIGFPNKEESDSHFDGWISSVFEPLNDYFTVV